MARTFSRSSSVPITTSSWRRSPTRSCQRDIIQASSADGHSDRGNSAHHLPFDSSPVLVGRLEQVVEQLLQRRRRWNVSEWIIRVEQMRDFAPVVARLSEAGGG